MNSDREPSPQANEPRFTVATFLKAVGISESTLNRWTNDGVVPRRISEGGVRYFTALDAEFARRVRELLRERTGQLALWEAVDVVRGDMKLPKQNKAPGPITSPDGWEPPHP